MKKIMLLDETVCDMVQWDCTKESFDEIKEMTGLKVIFDKETEEIIHLYSNEFKRECVLPWNLILKYPNGRIDIVNESWLNSHTKLYNSRKTKKKYHYFVSAIIWDDYNNIKGIISGTISTKFKISTNEDIELMKKTLKEQHDYKNDECMIINYKLLRIEELEE